MLGNIAKDQKEHVDEVVAIMDGLKPWLNLQLYQAERKSKRNDGETLINAKYIENLRKHGMSEETIGKLTNKLRDQQEPEDDIDPPMRVIK